MESRKACSLPAALCFLHPFYKPLAPALHIWCWFCCTLPMRVTCIKRWQTHLIWCTSSINKDNEWHVKDWEAFLLFVSKDFLCAKCPHRMKTFIWLQVIFAPSFYRAPLDFWFSIYHRNNDKGVCSCWTVLPTSMEPRREEGRYSSGLHKTIKVFKWKSKSSGFAKISDISQAVFLGKFRQ